MHRQRGFPCRTPRFRSSSFAVDARYKRLRRLPIPPPVRTGTRQGRHDGDFKLFRRRSVINCRPGPPARHGRVKSAGYSNRAGFFRAPFTFPSEYGRSCRTKYVIFAQAFRYTVQKRRLAGAIIWPIIPDDIRGIIRSWAL